MSFDPFVLAVALALVGCSRPETASTMTTEKAIGPSMEVTATETRLSALAAPPVQALEVEVGDLVSCARFADGGVRCWGAPTEDDWLGLGDAAHSSLPTLVEGFPLARALAVGARHACIIDDDGHVHCWGYNGEGQLGDGTTTSRPQPVLVEGLHDVVEIDASNLHTCARTSVGEVFCWGQGWVVGNGTDFPCTRPSRVMGLDQVTGVELGPETSCAIRRDRSLWCWGLNGSGVFGSGAGPFRRAKRIGSLQVTQVAIGDRHLCVVDEQHLLWCMGNDWAGELIDQFIPDNAECETRDNAVTCRFYEPEPPRVVEPLGEPEPDLYPPPPRFARVFKTETFPARHELERVLQPHSRGVQADGRFGIGRTCLGSELGVRCWGALHRPDWAYRGYAPIIPGTEGVTEFDVGPSHGCAVRADGSVVCWGQHFSRPGMPGSHRVW